MILLILASGLVYGKTPQYNTETYINNKSDDNKNVKEMLNVYRRNFWEFSSILVFKEGVQTVQSTR